MSDAIAPDSAKVMPLLDEAAEAYAEKNAGLARARRAVRQQVTRGLPASGQAEGRSIERLPFSTWLWCGPDKAPA